MGSFNLASHVRELDMQISHANGAFVRVRMSIAYFETNDWMFNELLAKCLTFVGVFEGFLVTNTCESVCLDDYSYSVDLLVYSSC